MKTFRTILPQSTAPFRLTHADRLLLVGSCFTEHMGRCLADGKFSVLVNPNGIVYNPVSIAAMLDSLLDDAPGQAPLVELNGLWHSWQHHGHFSRPDRTDALEAIHAAWQTAAAFLAQTNRLIITLGTAEVFSLRETGQIVANNHKAPADWFGHRRLGVAETVAVLKTVLVKLKNRLPDLEVILTVSPVRHLRNGFVENQRSKAVLLLACAELCDQLGFAGYFPAFELLLDDLRDYRFYASDMVHPAETAVEYIWQYFAETYFPAETRRLLDQIEKIAAAARHRPFHAATVEYRNFARKQLEAIRLLEQTHPMLDFSAEKSWFEQYSL